MQQRNVNYLLENASGCIVESINSFSKTEFILHCICSKLIFLHQKQGVAVANHCWEELSF